MTGRQTAEGFLPQEPNVNALLNQVLGGGWSGLDKSPAGDDLAKARLKAHEDLKRCYVSVFATPAGQKVLEDFLDQSLRRCPYKPGGNASIEEQTAYGLERMGQNGFVTYILKMIKEGQNLPAPGSSRRKRK